MKIALIDCDNLSHRGFYRTYRGPGAPILTAPDGTPTNAIATWSSMLTALMDKEQFDRTIIVLEGRSVFRRGIWPDYKATRVRKPDPLVQQLPIISAFVRDSSLEYAGDGNEEADDVIATLAKRFARGGDTVYIASDDKDFAQCVNDSVFQLRPESGGYWHRVDRRGVIDKFGVPPEMIPSYLALVGDTADNIPGIDLIGPEKAAKALADSPDYPTIIQRVAALKKKWPVTRVQELVALNLQLTTVRDELDIEVQRGHCPERAIQVLRSLACVQAADRFSRLIPPTRHALQPVQGTFF